MRVAVVYFGQSEKLRNVSTAYAEGISTQGHEVLVIDGLKNTANLFVYDYLLLGTEVLSLFSSQIENSVRQCLKNMGSVAGKASYAFLLRRGLWSTKSLQLWMKWLESCGLLLLLSDVVVKDGEARYIGEHLKIYK